MAERNKRGLKTVETNLEVINEKVRQRRKKIIKRTAQVLGGILILVILLELFYALRNFESYEIRNSANRSNGMNSLVCEYQNYIVEYSNDGISCITRGGEYVWNQSYEMNSPKVSVCGEYIVVYDNGGKDIYILTESGLQKQIKVTSPIEKVCIAEQGTIAVLMRENSDAQVKLFDKKGNELANGKFYGNKGSFPRRQDCHNTP